MEIAKVKRRVRLRDLDTLVAVVHTGAMRKAAEQLHLSQAAVSKAVQELERAFGVALLERSSRGVEATACGQALVRRAKAVFDELQGALREFEHLGDPAGGEVHLGCMETLHAGLVGAAVERLVHQHPRMRFQFESGQSPELIDHFLRERLVEFVIARPYVLPLPPGIEGEPLFHDQLRVVVGLESPFARRRRLTLDELAGESWILSRNELLPQTPVVEAFAAAGLPMPAQRVISGSLNMRYNLLATGRFVTVMPHSLLPFAKHRSMVRVLPVPLPLWRTPTMILTLQGRTLGPAARLFLATVRELAKPLVIG